MILFITNFIFISQNTTGKTYFFYEFNNFAFLRVISPEWTHFYISRFHIFEEQWSYSPTLNRFITTN